MRTVVGVAFSTVEGVVEHLVKAHPHPVQFSNCNFSKLDLRAVYLDRCVFDGGCVFRKTRLGSCRYVEFYSCDLRHADFTQADIRWARSMNCRADAMDIVGAQMTLDCHFFSGLISQRESDGWRLARWSALLDSPARLPILAGMPPQVALLVSLQFAADPAAPAR